MGSSSSEESDISDTEIDEYKDKPYQLLKSGFYKIKGPNGVLRCPFCAGKKKQDYQFNHLYQHAIGVAKGTAKSAKQRANHLALANYLDNSNPGEAEPVPQQTPAPPPPKPEQSQLYCWPWVGILANISREQMDEGNLDSTYWLNKYSKYKPSGIELFWDAYNSSAQAIVKFDYDWDGLKNALEFEKYFAARGRSREGWENRKSSADSDIYGWFARDNDYKSEGPVGDYLRNKSELKTISDVIQEATKDRNKVVGTLVQEIDMKNENLDALETQYNHKTLSLTRMLQEKDELHQIFCEETRKMQRMARERIKSVLDEQEMLNSDLERKKRELDTWSKELNKREALTERDRLKLEEEKRKNEQRNNSLQKATEEQRKADGNVLRLVEEQQREKEEAVAKVLELERKLGERQKLEMEILELKGKLEVIKHMGGENDEGVQLEMKKMKKELEEKNESLSYLEETYNQMLLRERQHNDELQSARKLLIESLTEMLSSNRVNIGIKRMGEIDEKAFKNICKQKFPPGEADLEAAKLCSMWQEKLKHPDWHPFRIITDANGNSKEEFKADYESLQELREEWGDEAYDAVATASKEIHEYNPSGCYITNELWNFKEGRKATLKEVIAFIFAQMKTLKRKRG